MKNLLSTKTNAGYEFIISYQLHPCTPSHGAHFLQLGHGGTEKHWSLCMIILALIQDSKQLYSFIKTWQKAMADKEGHDKSGEMPTNEAKTVEREPVDCEGSAELLDTEV